MADEVLSIEARLTADSRKYRKEMDRAQKETKEFGGTAKKATKAADRGWDEAAHGARNYNTQAQKAGRHTRNTARGLDDIRNKSRGLDRGFAGIAGNLKTLLGGALSIGAGVQIVRKMIQDIEQEEAKGAQSLQQRTEYGKKLSTLPFPRKQLEKESKHLQRVADLSAKEAIDTVFAARSSFPKRASEFYKMVPQLAATQGDVAGTADILKTIVQNFPEISEKYTLAQWATMIGAGAERAKATVPQLASALPKAVQATGKLPGLKPEDVLAMTTTLTGAMKQPEEAGTALRSFLMLSATEKMGKHRFTKETTLSDIKRMMLEDPEFYRQQATQESIAGVKLLTSPEIWKEIEAIVSTIQKRRDLARDPMKSKPMQDWGKELGISGKGASYLSKSLEQDLQLDIEETSGEYKTYLEAFRKIQERQRQGRPWWARENLVFDVPEDISRSFRKVIEGGTAEKRIQSPYIQQQLLLEASRMYEEKLRSYVPGVDITPASRVLSTAQTEELRGDPSFPETHGGIVVRAPQRDMGVNQDAAYTYYARRRATEEDPAFNLETGDIRIGNYVYDAIINGMEDSKTTLSDESVEKFARVLATVTNQNGTETETTTEQTTRDLQ